MEYFPLMMRMRIIGRDGRYRSSVNWGDMQTFLSEEILFCEVDLQQVLRKGSLSRAILLVMRRDTVIIGKYVRSMLVVASIAAALPYYAKHRPEGFFSESRNEINI